MPKLTQNWKHNKSHIKAEEAEGRELECNLQPQGISKWVRLKDESRPSNFKQLAHCGAPNQKLKQWRVCLLILTQAEIYHLSTEATSSQDKGSVPCHIPDRHRHIQGLYANPATNPHTGIKSWFKNLCLFSVVLLQPPSLNSQEKKNMKQQN